MATEIYGASDDLIEFEGDFRGEVGCYGTDEEEHSGVLVVVSDGTVLKVKYCGRVPGVWEVAPLRKGTLFDRIDHCDDEDAKRHSDTAVFRDGVKWAYAAAEWEAVQ